ncbi:phospho-sugar mutase [Staphylospora marina]|uniref:phospho-sugar mutase n=1 Tax=Staphylospora marina TaxID=2490858 RepID=UPI000F5BB82B|nr:phospho-sugar mutase [Staphylospora marina]
MNETYLHWLNHPRLDPGTRKELESLRDAAEIEDRFSRHLSFGTAGMRGIIGAGTNRMNRYTVRRATAGFARHLLKQFADVHERGVVVAHDSRKYSAEFASEAAGVFAAHGIPVYLFPELRPTPVLSFAVRHLGARGGVMITASHNPPEYNGYKVYGPDGAQSGPETAGQIQREIAAVKDEIELDVLSLAEGTKQGLILRPGPEVDEAYMEHVKSLSLRPDVIRQAADDLRIVYTPLHGTGLRPVTGILSELGIRHIHIVDKQATPDPAFPHAPSPNPEEPEALRMALVLAAEKDADLVIATDPDADRLGVAVRHGGEYVPLTGNQIGALLLHYMLERRRELGILPENGLILKTIVTSELGRKVADTYGVATVDLLTGFKFIAEKIEEAGRSGTHTFLMGYEESYGYLFGDFVRDKDAVQAAMLAAEMTAWHKLRGETLVDVLDRLFAEHGVHQETLVSYTLPGADGLRKMEAWMDALRRTPFSEIGGIPVLSVEDYAHGFAGLPPSNVLKFKLADESWVAVRPSGTEPKIKFYFGAVGSTREETASKLERMKRTMLKPVE